MATLILIKDPIRRRDRRGKLITKRIRIVKHGDLVLNGPVLSRGEHYVKLPKRQGDIMAALMLSGGKRVDKAMLVDFLWPDLDAEPDGSWNCIQVTISLLRKRIKPLNLGVKTFYGAGWELWVL